MSPAPDLTGPRSVRAHAKVLSATLGLLREGGLSAATIDEIATRSWVSKSTIYNHWPSRVAIAAEAFGEAMADATPLPDTGSVRDDLVIQVQQVSAFYASPDGRIFAQLLAAGVDDPEGARYFRDFFLAGRRDSTRQLWQRAIDAGIARPNIHADTAADLPLRRAHLPSAQRQHATRPGTRNHHRPRGPRRADPQQLRTASGSAPLRLSRRDFGRNPRSGHRTAVTRTSGPRHRTTVCVVVRFGIEPVPRTWDESDVSWTIPTV